MPNADALLALALAAARAGGDATLAHFGRPLAVGTKADGSPVTAADLASHWAVTAALAPSGVAVVSEEGDDPAAQPDAPFWCVDPLDGTKEFVRGPEAGGQFAVHVALVARGAPTLGVVRLPALGVTYWAAAGRAWRQRDGGLAERIRTRPAADGLAVLTSRDHGGPDLDAVLGRIAASGRPTTVQAAGSSLKVCRVAEGSADLYPRTGPTFEWDTAAPQALVEAAGGGVSTADGARLTYGKPGLRNPSFVCWGDPALDWQPWLAPPSTSTP